MSGPEGSLLGILRSRLSGVKLDGALRGAGEDLGLGAGELLSQVCVAYALLRLDFQVEQVSRLLSWREFEQLSAALFRVAGFLVRENVVLTRPRAQIDLIATGESLVLSVDCKHHRREHGPSAIGRVAVAQLGRSALLRRKTEDPKPIASVILSMSEPEGRFVKGVAVVPVKTLRSFLNSLDSYVQFFDLR